LAWVDETDLSEHAGLIPVDMLVGDFVPFKFHHDNMRQRYFPPGRRNPWKYVINRAVVRKIYDELVHHLVPAHRPRDPLDACIGRHFADEVVCVKIDYTRVAATADERGHVVHTVPPPWSSLRRRHRDQRTHAGHEHQRSLLGPLSSLSLLCSLS